MTTSKDALALIKEFIDDETVNAVATYGEDANADPKKCTLIAAMLGYSGGAGESFSALPTEKKEHLAASFKKNLTLLIEKTWIEQTDAVLKEEILYKLSSLFKATEGTPDWQEVYSKMLEITQKAVYLMFGEEAHGEGFGEYSMRIDPEFGLFWYFVSSLPEKPQWTNEKFQEAILLGMYFLANY